MKFRLFTLLALLSLTLPTIATAQSADSIHITHQRLYTQPALAIGNSVAIEQITIEAVTLSQTLTIEVNGANRTQFALASTATGTGSASVTLPAGNTTHTIYLLYQPTAKGTHKAGIYYSSADEKLAGSLTLVSSIMAYDPATPPTISVDLSTVHDLSVTAAEQSAYDTVRINTSNLLDYNGKLIVDTTCSAMGTFRIISNNMFQKDATQNYVIQFYPKEVGTYSATFLAVAPMADTVRFTIHGYCATAPQPEQREGDSLVLSTEGALAQYRTDFNSLTHNNPLSLTGWTNAATVGTRAWWGYQFPDDTVRCAKVTCFDSQAAGPADCQMLLVSPALDANIDRDNRQVGFRLQGQFLAEGQTDRLTVCYIDLADDSLYVLPMPVAVPETPAEANTWQDIVLHLEDQDLADAFFIGFLFTGTRGAGHSATYYIDDFSWGYHLQDIPSALHNTHNAPKAIKRLENGHIVILRDGVRYSILGLQQYY